MAPRPTFVRNASVVRTLAESSIGALLIFGLDMLTGYEISVGVFYLYPVFRVAWLTGRRYAIPMCVFCAGLWIAADFYSGHTYSSPMILYGNGLVRFAYFISVAALAWWLRQERDRHALIARTDALTGLPNRLAFLEIAGHVSQRSLRRKSAVALAYLDVDNFKQVNDQQGHSAGDELLRIIGHTLKQTSRASDLAARLGGDEFALLLPDTDLPGAQVVVQKVRAALMKSVKQNHWPVSFSIGCIAFMRGATVDEMVRRADALMYEVKNRGKDTINFDMTSGETVRIGTQVF